MRKTLAPAAILSTLFAVGNHTRAAQADDPKPSVATSFKVPPVAAACKAGGQKAAKKLMNKAKKVAVAAGEEFKCKGCHKDLKTFELTGPKAIEDLKRYLK
ncbi:MAG: hypothetical protein AAF721_36375 [Myxococcota bacterium]